MTMTKGASMKLQKDGQTEGSMARVREEPD